MNHDQTQTESACIMCIHYKGDVVSVMYENDLKCRISNLYSVINLLVCVQTRCASLHVYPLLLIYALNCQYNYIYDRLHLFPMVQ